MTRGAPWLLLCLLAAGCGPGKARAPLITDPAALRWPPKPAQARIRYLGQVRGSAAQSGVAEVIAGEGEGLQMERPYAVTVTPQNVLVVTDPGDGKVNLFDLTSQAHTVIDAFNGTPFGNPVGAAADAQGRIYISDSEARRVFVLSATGEPLRSFGGAMKRPTGITVDRKRGVLYVADTKSHRIHARTVGGRYLFGIGRQGQLPGQFHYPTHLGFDPYKSRLLVCDTLNFRVQVLDRRGKPLSVFGQMGDSSGALARPKGIAADSKGHIYVTDALFNVVQIFDVSGQLLLYFGRDGKRPGNLSMPAGLHIDRKDRIFVANMMNRRVEVFQYLGKTGRKQ